MPDDPDLIVVIGDTTAVTDNPDALPDIIGFGPRGPKGDKGDTGAGAADASSTVKGVLRLTNDLGGTADSPTVPGLATKQPLDSDLTSIAGLSPSNDDVVQRKAGAWTNRTPAQLKTDLALSKSDVGLGNVDNTSDASKPISSATQSALDSKADTSALTAHTGNTNNPHSVTKTQVGLGNVDNTSDVNKPVSTAQQTALDGKEPTITSGTTGQYWRGDKSWQTLDKSAVGLGNVDNTSDASKPISTATQTALDSKVQVGGDLGGTITSPQVKSRTVTKTVGPAGSSSDYVCDGTADNVELQAAIDAVFTAGGGTVLVRAGSYAIAAKLRIRSNVHLMGEDRETTVFNFGAGINDTMVENFDTGAGNSNIWVCNLTLNGNGSNNTAGYALHLSAVTNSIISRISVTSSYSHGFLLDGTNSNNVIEDMSITGVSGSSSEGLYVNNSTNTRITRVTSFSNPHYGVYLANSSKLLAEELRSYSNTYEGIVLWATSDSTVKDSESYSNGTTGMRLDNGSHRNTVEKIYIHNNGAYGLLCGVSAGPQNEFNKLLSNTVTYNGDDAFVVDHANYATVIGNYVGYNGSHAGDQGMAIDNSKHVVCVGNKVEFNRADGIELKNGSHYSTVSGNVVRNNSNSIVGGINDGRGIVLRDGITGCTVSGNTVFCDEVTPSQVYGIELTGAGNDYNNVTGNTTYGNSAGQIHLLASIGTNNVVAENSGADDGRMQAASKMVNATTGNGIYIQQTGAVAASRGAVVIESTADQSTANSYGLIAVRQKNASTTGRGIWVDHDGTGEGIQVRSAQGKGIILDNNGNALALDVDHDGNSASAITSVKIDAVNAGAGAAYGLVVSNGLSGLGSTTPTALLDLGASTTARSSLRLRSGTAPTSPNDGDVWYDGTHLRARIGSTTYQIDQQSGGGSGTSLSRSVTQTSHGLSVGNLVRFNGTSYVTAQADSAINAEVVGIVSTVTDANTFTLLTGGYITGLSSLTAGEVYFLSPTTAGLLTSTEPTTAGLVSKPALIADSTTSGYFINTRGVVISNGTSVNANWQASDSGLIAWSYDNVAASNNTVVASAGVMQCVRLAVPSGTITNLILDVATAGSGLTSAGAAIYQNGSLLGQTADQSTAWQSTNAKVMALTSPVAVSAGYVYVTFWANGTTLPAFSRAIQRSAVTTGQTSSNYRFATSGSSITTTPPSTLGTLTALSTSWWVGVS